MQTITSGNSQRYVSKIRSVNIISTIRAEPTGEARNEDRENQPCHRFPEVVRAADEVESRAVGNAALTGAARTQSAENQMRLEVQRFKHLTVSDILWQPL